MTRPSPVFDKANDQWVRDGITETYNSDGSHQSIWADLTMGTATAGGFVAAIMGNVLDGGSAVAAADGYVGGVIGAYSATSGTATTYAEAGVIALVQDGVADQAVNAFTAVLGGDSAETTAKAAYGVMYDNSTAASKFTYGVDLYGASHDGYQAVSYAEADIRFSSGGLLATFTTAITANSTTTSLAAGTLGKTTHATGRASLFVSDGTKWQYLTNA